MSLAIPSRPSISELKLELEEVEDEEKVEEEDMDT